MNDPRGSIWRKWDLHVHTPASIVSRYACDRDKDIWEEYISDLESLPSEFKVLGINDYLFLDGYERLLYEKNNNKRIQNIDLLLPVVEFRISKFAGVDFRNTKRVNMHVIFSNEVAVETIKSQFLATLDQSYFLTPGIDSSCWNGTITKQSLEDLGKQIKESVPKDRLDDYGTDIEEGFNNLNLDNNQIYTSLNKPYFKDKYLIAIGKTEWDELRWSDSSISEKKDVINRADLVFTAAESPVKWFNAKNKLKEQQVNDLLLDCSDSHCFSSSTDKDKIGNCFTWIKADPTFEGLKQIVFEPEGRVSVQEDNPAETESYAKIEKMVFELPPDVKIVDNETNDEVGFCFSEKHELNFSNNFTCIIGGRGSGKSTLGHLLFSCIDGDSKRLEMISSPLLNLKLEPSPLKYMSEKCSCIGPNNTEFFFQNEIEKTAKDVAKMSNLISSRLNLLSALSGNGLKCLKNEWEKAYSKMEELEKAYGEISETQMKINAFNNEINNLKKQTEVMQSDQYKKLQDENLKISDEIANFNKYSTEYERVLGQIDFLLNGIRPLKWDKEQGNEILVELRRNLEVKKKEIDEQFNNYKKKYDDLKCHKRLEENKKQLKLYLDKKGMAAENIYELTSANERISISKSKIEILKETLKPHNSVYSKKDKLIEEYKEKYNAYKNLYDNTAKDLQSTLMKLELPGKATISFKLESNYQQLKSNAVEMVKSSLAGETTNAKYLRKILFDNSEIIKYINDKNNIKQRVLGVDKAGKNASLLIELMNDSSFVERMHLKLIKDYYDVNNIQCNTKMGGKSLSNTSFGERCAIVITLILAAGTNPILIDQPEDHLDSRFITEFLVPLIRERKRSRQIILITRDANIVIGGDADLINILKEKNQTEIVPSTIENIYNREDYIWILDGGKDAFKKREKKYNI